MDPWLFILFDSMGYPSLLLLILVPKSPQPWPLEIFCWLLHPFDKPLPCFECFLLSGPIRCSWFIPRVPSPPSGNCHFSMNGDINFPNPRTFSKSWTLLPSFPLAKPVDRITCPWILSKFLASLVHLVFCLFLFLIHLFILFLAALGLRCSARVSHCGGFSPCRAWALATRASVVVARGLSSCGSWAQ